MNEWQLKQLLMNALSEDIGTGDITTALTIAPTLRGGARLIARESVVISGLTLIAPLLALSGTHDWQCSLMLRDGDLATPGMTIAQIEGPLGALLTTERVLLNFIMHLSGIATVTQRAVQALQGSRTQLLDTRKTTPGLRFLEKQAVRHGGGLNHRLQLSDGILIKDNHIAACGSLRAAVSQAKQRAPHLLKIECEVDELSQIEEAISAGADMLLLDNMDNETLRQAVLLVKGRVPLEASGNMSLERLPGVAQTGVDFVSMGALTHSAPAANLSLEVHNSHQASS